MPKDSYELRELSDYLGALTAVYRAYEERDGWCWSQSIEPREQSVQLADVGGMPIAGHVQRNTVHDCMEISVAFYDSDGCSASHVSVNEGVYHAARMDYGPDAAAISNVSWTDNGEESVTILS